MANPITSRKITRRNLIRLMVASGATLALASVARVKASSGGTVFRPNAYLEISAETGVVLWLKKAEMGQQILTATAMMMADELGADLDTLTVRQADTHPRFGFVGTGGSFAIPGRWNLMRPLFASARIMLLQAAAKTWSVPFGELKIEKGLISHEATRRREPLESFAALATKLEVPQDPPLREPGDFLYIGTHRGRLDASRLLDGSAKFGMDVRQPGQRYAVMARPPTRDGVLETWDENAALSVPGVEEVHVIGEKVAVIAGNSWAAMRGRDALQASWNGGEFRSISNESIRTDLRNAFSMKGAVVRSEGKLPDGQPVIDASYEMPMAQHAAIEPANATALVEDGMCTIWAPVQMATQTKVESASAIGIPEENVTVHTTLLGGSFGRKLERDFAIEAARIAALTKGPVQLLLTREDDMAEAGVRPPSQHRIRIWNNDDVSAMAHEYATHSVFAQQDPAQLNHRGFDWTSALGAADMPYRFDRLSVIQHDVEQHAVRLNWWRGTHHNHHAFAIECAMDEFALATGKDPIDLRLSMLEQDTTVETFPNEMSTVNSARLKRLLLRLREILSQADESDENRAVGIACHVYTDVHTYVAHAVEVSLTSGELKIHRVWALVDCGLAISPQSVKAQMEGSVVFGLNSALWGETRVENGQITDLNFNQCRLMRISETPEIEVIIVESDEPPGGMGEPPLPSVTPALLNAIARAGGPRIRKLPIGNQLT